MKSETETKTETETAVRSTDGVRIVVIPRNAFVRWLDVRLKHERRRTLLNSLAALSVLVTAVYIIVVVLYR
jgi:CRP-like cAMP-binding protein